MFDTAAARFGACLAGALVGVFLVVAVPGCQWGDGVTLLPPGITTIEATLDDSVLMARIKAALLLSPVVGSTGIAVDVIKGAVLLSGPTEDATQSELALFVVTNVPGVVRVESILITRSEALAAHAGQREALDTGAARASFMRSGTLIPMQGPEKPGPVSLQSPVADEGVIQANGFADGSSASFAARSRAVFYGVLGIASVHDELLIKR